MSEAELRLFEGTGSVLLMSHMYNIGLVSVSFRQLSVEAIIALCRENNLPCVEWGSDVHAPCHDEARLAQIVRLQKEQGIACSSYGTYFRIGTHPTDELMSYIHAARILGTNILRLWCGTRDYEDMTPDERAHIISEAQKAAKMAEQEGVVLCLECHHHTFTNCLEGIMTLMKAVNSPAFRMYWQPNQFKSAEENLETARTIAPYTQNIHVFHWDAAGRYPLSDGLEAWKKYLAFFDKTQTLLLEFMPDDHPASLPAEAEALRQLTKGVSPVKTIFLCQNPTTVSSVYAPETVEHLAHLTELSKSVYTKADVLAHPEDFSHTEYIFSTWGMPAFTEEEIKSCFPRLKCVFYGAGTVQSFARPFLNCGVRVFSAWAANAVPVAEYTVAQIILANKGFFAHSRLMKQGDHETCHVLKRAYPGNYDECVGLIGVGMIGTLVAEMLKDYRLTVKACDPFLSDEKAAALGVTKCSLQELFETCRVVSNHMADKPATRGMLNRDCFARMLPYATFINTGRGAQVVEDDLVAVLTERPDVTAILDVTYPEPPAAGHPFYHLENCVLTPHIAGSLMNETHRMAEYMRMAFETVRAGNPCPWEVTAEMLATMA